MDEIAKALKRVGIKVLSSDVKRHKKAQELVEYGLAAADIYLLAKEAYRVGRSPVGLLWFWLQNPRRAKDVLADVRCRDKFRRKSDGDKDPLTAREIIDSLRAHGSA